MANYYFLGTLLPELKMGEAPDIHMEAFIDLLAQNLNSKDLTKVSILLRYFDIENIRAFWTGREFDAKGNMDQNALEESLLTLSGLPAYVYDFMENHGSLKSRISQFPALLAAFFTQEIAAADGFLKEFLIRERAIRLVLGALRSKKYGRDLVVEMQFENPEDDLVFQILAQKDAKTYEPPEEYQGLKTLFMANQNEPLSLHKALLSYRFETLQNLIGLHTFTIDRILAYLFQLFLVEKWMKLKTQDTLFQGFLS